MDQCDFAIKQTELPVQLLFAGIKYIHRIGHLLPLFPELKTKQRKQKQTILFVVLYLHVSVFACVCAHVYMQACMQVGMCVEARGHYQVSTSILLFEAGSLTEPETD